MKNYRLLIPIALTLLMCLSIYNLIFRAIEQDKNLQLIVNKAEKSSSQGLYDKAVSYYNEAMTIDSNAKYYLKIIDMYDNAGQFEDGLSWCKTAINDFPDEVGIYEKMINTYLKLEKISDAYNCLDEADAKKINSPTLNKYKKYMEYLYFTESNFYEDITQSCTGYIGIKNNEKWGLATDAGQITVSPKFKQIGYFCNDIVPVLGENNQWYFMNSEGEYEYNISLSINKSIKKIGLYNEGVFPICINNTYFYYNLKFKKEFDSYDYAGSFNEGVAAVKKGDKWFIIDNKGNPITKDIYVDVLLDERGICCKYGRIFVKKSSDEYVLIDTKGNRIGKESFEDAQLFLSDKIAAIKQDGLWGFADISGEIVTKPQYDEAKSYVLGLAPVKRNNYWGYIDKSNAEIIKSEYDDCYEFSSKGIALVKQEKNWKMIKLYKYYH